MQRHSYGILSSAIYAIPDGFPPVPTTAIFAVPWPLSHPVETFLPRPQGARMHPDLLRSSLRRDMRIY